MVDLDEGFREVEKDSVYLARLIEAVGEVAESGYELSFTTSTVAKAMLKVRQDRVVVKEVHDRAMDDVLEKLANDAG